MKAYLPTLILAVVLAVAVWAFGQLAATRKAAALDISMVPAPCYDLVGEIVKNSQHFALIFNKCEPGFRWHLVPDPPERAA